MLGRGGRPPPCLLWFVARLNESENKRIIMSLNMGKSHPAALASVLGWEAPLSRRSCCLMQNPTRCSSSCAQSRARSHRPAWPAQPTIASFASTTDRLNPIQCKIQCNRDRSAAPPWQAPNHWSSRSSADRSPLEGRKWNGFPDKRLELTWKPVYTLRIWLLYLSAVHIDCVLKHKSGENRWEAISPEMMWLPEIWIPPLTRVVERELRER